MSFKKQITIIGISALLLAAPFAVSAAGVVPCGGPPPESPCTVKDIFVIIARATNTLVALAGIYAVYQILSAGFWMVTTMGNEEKITQNKKWLTNAVVGFVMVMFAYIFVNTAVNYILLEAGKNKDCKLDLRDPLNYVFIHNDPAKHALCRK